VETHRERGRTAEVRAGALQPAPLRLDQLPQLLWISSREGKLLYANRTWLDYTGVDPDQKPSPTWVQVIHAQDRQPAERCFQSAALGAGKSGVRCRVRGKDGTHRWFIVKLTACDSEAAEHCFVGAAIEIDDQLAFDDLARRNDNLYREIVETATEGILMIDDRYVMLYVNEQGAAMFGTSPKEMLGHSAIEFLFEEERKEFERRMEQRRRGVSSTADLRFRRADGSEFWAHIVSTPIYGPDGQYRGALGMFTDITARRDADQKLRDYSELLRTLSHRLIEVQEAERRNLARELHDEIGQILTLVSINLRTIDGTGGAAARQRLDDSIDIVDQLIQQVRALSLDLRPSMLDDLGLGPALRWFADQHTRRTGIQIRLSMHLESRLSSALETACFRIIQEGISNVVRHADAEHVWITLAQTEESIELAIQDDGVGFDLDEARQSAMRGSSAGLLGMQERVRLLGGQIDIDSSPANLGLERHGTEVRVRIPLRQEAP
jgi:PAS domain S-box-containing protein